MLICLFIIKLRKILKVIGWKIFFGLMLLKFMLVLVKVNKGRIVKFIELFKLCFSCVIGE